MRTYIAGFFIAFLFAVPLFTHAQTAQAQIQALLAQVQYLQSLLSAIEGSGQITGNAAPILPTTTPNTAQTVECITLTRSLGIGDSGAEVTKLQTFLAKYPALYPEKLVTGYYGSLTARAVERFQAQQGVVQGGTPATTGFGVVGPKTRAAFAKACSGGSFDPAINRDLVVTPRIGQVPLAVTATFSLNGSSCSSFSLDWGDGTVPITFDAGENTGCSRDIAHKEAKHTYQSAGAYAVVLRAHQGPLAEAKVVGKIPVYVGVPVPANFSLAPNNGPAPLTTSVTFPVFGSNCTSFELDWGDGTIDRKESPQTTGCAADTGTEARTHVYNAPGTYDVTLKTGHGALSGLPINERWVVTVGEPIGGAALSFTSTSGTVPFTVNATVAVDASTCASYYVNWGDGTAPQQFDASTGGSCTQGQRTFTHTYIAPGTYAIVTKVGVGALDDLPQNTQPITVLGQQTQACSDPRPVCGEVPTSSCPIGYTCSASRKNYPNQCAMQAEGAFLIQYGTCQ